MNRNDAPKQVRIRTNPADDLGHRYEAIVNAQEALDAGSKTEAVVHSCDLITRLSQVLPEVLEELPPDQAEQIAEELSGRGLNIEYEEPKASFNTLE